MSLEVGTFTDSALIGVITFYSVGVKNGFWRKIRNHGVTLSNDRMLKFESNESFEVRKPKSGTQPNQISDDRNTQVRCKDIKILRKTGEVKLKSETVGEVKTNASMIFTEKTRNIKESVENHMQEWTEKRTQTRE